MKKTQKLLFTICITVLSLLFINGVYAEGAKVAIGLGAGAAPDYEGSDDMQGVPLILLDAQWENYMSVNIMGSRGRINLMPHPVLRIGLAAEYIGERDDDVDNAQMNLLPDVDASVMLGGFVGFEKNGWIGSLEAMTDVADGNDGSIARLNFGYSAPMNEVVKLGINVFTTWADDDYMDAYFTVTAAGEAASGLRAYKAESGIKDVGINLSLHYMPWQNWGIMGLVGYKKMLGDASDSPIVDTVGNDGQFSAGLMLTYRF